MVLSLVGSLDQGEAAAIAQALTIRADLLLIDERKGRSAARRLGLAVKGTLGVLLTARRRGLIGAVAPPIEELQRSGVYLSASLVEAVLQAAGET